MLHDVTLQRPAAASRHQKKLPWPLKKLWGVPIATDPVITDRDRATMSQEDLGEGIEGELNLQSLNDTANAEDHAGDQAAVHFSPFFVKQDWSARPGSNPTSLVQISHATTSSSITWGKLYRHRKSDQLCYFLEGQLQGLSLHQSKHKTEWWIFPSLVFDCCLQNRFWVLKSWLHDHTGAVEISGSPAAWVRQEKKMQSSQKRHVKRPKRVELAQSIIRKEWDEWKDIKRGRKESERPTHYVWDPILG